VIAAARSSADRLVWLMTVKHPPYDDTPARWFGVLDEFQRSYPPSGGTIS
jgi:hypothetical protein